MKDISRGGYSTAEIMDALYMKTGTRNISFRFDLLDEKEQKKGELKKVQSASISMDALADLKRTAKFDLIDEKETEVIEAGGRPLQLSELPTTLKGWL